MKQSGIRRQRLTERLREELELLLEHEMEDPSLEGVALSRISLSRDLATARVFVTLHRKGVEMDDGPERAELMAALERSTGYLRRRLAELLDLRRTPELMFSYDASARVVALIEEVAKDLPPEEPKEVANELLDTNEVTSLGAGEALPSDSRVSHVAEVGKGAEEGEASSPEMILDDSAKAPRVEFVIGDITLQEVDALVNAANTDLVLGSGVAGAILRRGGAEIQEDCNPLAPIPLGGAAVTGGGRLAARYVIHAAAMGYRAGEGMATRETVRDAYTNTLARAREHGISSIALPALGTGVGGFPQNECGAVFAEVVTAARQNAENQPSVLRVCFLSETARASFMAGYGIE